MTYTITFNELRKIKDQLPHGSMQKIADELNINIDTVRNYFGSGKYEGGASAGIHIEQGPDGASSSSMIPRSSIKPGSC
jgi:hypothetical protein